MIDSIQTNNNYPTNFLHKLLSLLWRMMLFIYNLFENKKIGFLFTTAILIIGFLFITGWILSTIIKYGFYTLLIILTYRIIKKYIIT